MGVQGSTSLAIHCPLGGPQLKRGFPGRTGNCLNRLLPIILFAIALLGAPAAMLAQSADGKGVWNALWENDVFTTGRSDRHYTSGLRFSYITRKDRGWKWVSAGARTLPYFIEDGHLRTNFAFGQNIHTPEGIKNPLPIPDDRPYAGWLYGAVGLTAAPWMGQSTGERAGGADQPRDEMAQWPQARSPAVAVCARVGGGRHAACVGRPGQRPGPGLRGRKHPTWQRPSLRLRPASHSAEPARLRVLCSHPHVRMVSLRRRRATCGPAQHLPRRNTFKDSLRVDKRYLLADVQAGLALTCDPVRFVFTLLLRSEEFHGQDGPDAFGAFALGIRMQPDPGWRKSRRLGLPRATVRTGKGSSRGMGRTGWFGRGGRIRTGGPLLPKQVRYQAALRPDRFFGGESGAGWIKPTRPDNPGDTPPGTP